MLVLLSVNFLSLRTSRMKTCVHNLILYKQQFLDIIMSDNMETNFKRVVEHIFNNWTALQLAVENDMGGPTSHQTAVEAMNWVCSYCLSQSDPQVSDLTETLEDILDEEFSTICEDDSPKEISYLLIKFLTYLREGNLQQFETDFNHLPVCKIWLSKGIELDQKVSKPFVQEENVGQSVDHQMDVDPEWTVVHRRKK